MLLHRFGRRGATLLEIAFAAGIAAIVLLALGAFIASTFRSTNVERDRTYALQKALQMMEELSAFKPTAANQTIDSFADGFKFELTTDPDAPAHLALSGNPKQFGKHKYVRNIAIEALPGDPYGRKVTVSVYYAAKSTTPAPLEGKESLAVVTNVLRSSIAAVGPRQIIDLYVISIENLPHVFRKNDDNQYFPSAQAARSAFSASLNTLKSTYSGLDFNLHVISRLGVGRDPYYRPYVNSGMAIHKDPDSSKRDPLNQVYFYPGVLDQDGNDAYYSADTFNGKIALGDASGVGAAAGTDADSYPLADQFNHVARFDAEFTPTAVTGGATVANSAAIKVPQAPTGETPDLSLRQLLEDMLTDATGKYRNAVIVNLHGELFPGLALRNYSDAAKDFTHADALKKQRRLVTHPWKLSTPVSEPVRLLVHPYMANGALTPQASSGQIHVFSTWSHTDYARDARIIVRGLEPYLADELTYDALDVGVSLKDVKITAIQRERKDSSPSGTNTEYVNAVQWPPALAGNLSTDGEGKSGRKDHSGPHAAAHAMGSPPQHQTGHAAHGADPAWGGAITGTTSSDLVIEVSELDFDAQKTANGSVKYGIDEGDLSNYSLHRLLYFPDPYLPFLTSPSDHTKPRNTARLIIEFNLKAAAAGKRFEVITQLKDASGNYPPVLATAGTADSMATSRTYVYAGATSDADWSATRELYWDSVTGETTIPWTEQLQLVGDPRHNPYLDVRKKGLYNPYFSNFKNAEEVYKGITNDNSSDAAKYVGTPSSLAAADAPPLEGGYVETSFTRSDHDWQDVKFNAPAYFRLWREALLRNDALFVNASGNPVRYLGLGGEFELEKSVNELDLKASKKPWDGSTSDAGSEANELFGARTALIERQDSSKWYSKPWIGELFPSDVAADWQTTGNLPTGSSAFLRVPLSGVDNWSYDTNKTDNDNRKTIGGSLGLPAFLNAEVTVGTTGPLDLDTGSGDKGTQTTTFKDIADQLRQSVIATTKAAGGYQLTGADTSTEIPTGWSDAATLAQRAKMAWLNDGVTPSGYYTHSLGGTYFAFNPIQIFDATGTSPRRAIMAVNASRPDKSSDVTKLFDLAVTSLVGTFFDGTNTALGEHNVKPLPRVKIKIPANSANVTGAVGIEFYAKWAKVDGNEYSPLYTYDGSVATASGGPLPVGYFIKYRNVTAGEPWKAADGTTVDAGVPPADSTLEIAHVAYPGVITGTWNAGSLTAGKYMLRIEGYRKSGTAYLGGHYTYHEIEVTLQ